MKMQNKKYVYSKVLFAIILFAFFYCMAFSSNWEGDSSSVTQGSNCTDSEGVDCSSSTGTTGYAAVQETDSCPDDPDKTEPGECGCGIPEGQCDAPTRGSIMLPVEVFGGAGTREERSFDLTSTEDIDYLYVQGQACGYHIDELDRNLNTVKAQVQINDHPPINIKAYTGHDGKHTDVFYGNPDITLIGPEAKAGGLGGAFRTARMKIRIDKSWLNEGVNTIAFIYKDIEPHSLGFRIIDFNLLRGEELNDKVLPPSAFIDDDPTKWTPIYTSAADIEKGRQLWNRRNSLYDLATDLSDNVGNGQGPNNGMIRASCGDCHLSSGRDHAYFNFSNNSIIKGAMSHKLTRKQGELMASFIRSVNVPRIRQARPWNPPYQPGPGLDQRPVGAWAAGAGVSAILERDEDTLAYLFPEGTSYAKVAKVVDRYGTLNMRELPVSISMPHWGAWLPPISPIDAFDLSHLAVLSDENGNRISRPFFEEVYYKAKRNPTRQNIADMFTRISKWWGRNATCYTQSVNNGPGYRSINGEVVKAIRLPHEEITENTCEDSRHYIPSVKNIELVKRGLASWIAVRAWEIIHENGLEREAAKQTRQYCTLGRCVSGAEPRGWVTGTSDDSFDIYHMAPHYLGYNSKHFSEKCRSVGIYEGNQWYHLQMILNPGYREVQTSHWGYTLVYLNSMIDVDDPAAARYYASIIKMRQCQTNGSYGDSNGLTLRTAQPFWYFSGENGERIGQLSLPNNLYSKIYEALTWDFLEAVQEGTQADWANATQLNTVQPRNSRDFSLSELGNGVFPHPGAIQGRNTYRLIDITSRGNGLEPKPSLDLQLELINWGKSMWPYGPWNVLRTRVQAQYE